MSHPDTLPTPDALAFTGVSRSTLKLKAKPVGYHSGGRQGRPTALWAMEDLERIRAERLAREEGRRHA